MRAKIACAIVSLVLFLLILVGMDNSWLALQGQIESVAQDTFVLWRLNETGTVQMVVLVVGELAQNINQRQAVRHSTEVARHGDVVVHFLVPGEAKQDEEQAEKDVVTVVDTKSEAETLKLGLKWAVETYPTSRYFSVVRGAFWPVRLLILASTVAKNPDDLFVLGNIIHMKVRQKQQDPSWIPGEYPAFPEGEAGYIVTRGVANYVARNANFLAHFSRGDISLGIWLDGLRVKWVHNDQAFRSDGECRKQMAVSSSLPKSKSIDTCLSAPVAEGKRRSVSMGLPIFRGLFSKLSSRPNEDIDDPRLALEENIAVAPESCGVKQTFDYILLVFSAPNYKARREAVRQVMVADGPVPSNVLFKFIVGKGEGDLEDTDDFIVMPMQDEYSKLPAKLKYAYTWVNECHPEAKFVIKVDDDVVFWPQRIVEFLQSIKHGEEEMLLIGGVMRNIDTKRSGKWAEHARWEPHYYPPIPLGSYGHIVSKSVYQYVAENAGILYEFQGEDSSLSIWLSSLNLRYVGPTPKMRNDKTCTRESIVVGHELDTKELMLACKAKGS